MKIVIKSKNLNLDQETKEYIIKKMEGVGRFEESFKGGGQECQKFLKKCKTLGEIFLEIGRETLHHKTGPVFRVEAQLKLPGKRLMGEATAEDLKSAATQLKTELGRELKQYTQKKISLARRKQRKIKKETHLSSWARLYRKGRIREEGL